MHFIHTHRIFQRVLYKQRQGKVHPFLFFLPDRVFHKVRRWRCCEKDLHTLAVTHSRIHTWNTLCLQLKKDLLLVFSRLVTFSVLFIFLGMVYGRAHRSWTHQMGTICLVREFSNLLPLSPNRGCMRLQSFVRDNVSTKCTCLSKHYSNISQQYDCNLPQHLISQLVINICGTKNE